MTVAAIKHARILCLQALTTSVAFWYGLEAFRLRAKADMNEVRGRDLGFKLSIFAAFKTHEDVKQHSYLSRSPPQQQGMLPPPDSVSQPFYDPQQQPQAFSPLQQQQQQPGGDYMGRSDGYANGGGYLPPGQADQSYYSWAPPQQQQEVQAAGSSRWGAPPPAAADNTIRWAPLPRSLPSLSGGRKDGPQTNTTAGI